MKCPKCKNGKIIYDQDFCSGLGKEYDMMNIRCNKCNEHFVYGELIK